MSEFNLPVFSLPVTFSIILMAMIFRYFGLVGLAFWLTQRWNEKNNNKWIIETKTTGKLQIKRDIYWSVLSTLIFSLSGTWLIYLWRAGSIEIYKNPAQYGYGYLVLSFLLLLILHDAYFYWTHRILHFSSLFKTIHKVHHESRIPTAWTAFSFHPGEALIQALILPAMLLLIPVHWTVLISFLTTMTILGIINHLGSEFYPKYLREKFPLNYFINASHHQKHHQKIKWNYGLYFNYWDKWMGTEDEGGTYVA